MRKIVASQITSYFDNYRPGVLGAAGLFCFRKLRLFVNTF